jgi:threonine dehydrogenase-like Zn-dependent dehydrogenase
VATLLRLTGTIGVDRAIDAVGIDADHPDHGPAAKKARSQAGEFEAELAAVAPDADLDGVQWKPGTAPSQVLQWAVSALCKAGTLSVIGVYPPAAKAFPIGEAMNKNLTLRMGNCNHRKYIPRLLELVVSGVIHPERILEQVEGMEKAIEAYRAFDARKAGWLKVELEPALG